MTLRSNYNENEVLKQTTVGNRARLAKRIHFLMNRYSSLSRPRRQRNNKKDAKALVVKLLEVSPEPDLLFRCSFPRRNDNKNINNVYSAPLKHGGKCHGTFEDDRGKNSNRTSGTEQGSAGKQTKVRFDEEVYVIKVKARKEYPKDIFESMYYARYEFEENVRRNKLEFFADGNDWRNCLEEDTMFNFPDDYYHPVHAEDNVEDFIKHRDIIIECFKNGRIPREAH